jgi:hypothetical protein
MWTVAFRSTIALHYTADEQTIQNEKHCCQKPTKQEHTVGNGQRMVDDNRVGPGDTVGEAGLLQQIKRRQCEKSFSY